VHKIIDSSADDMMAKYNFGLWIPNT